MTYTFDPRFSIYDSAESLEDWLIQREGISPKPSVQKAHLANLARSKTDAGRKHCADCALELALNATSPRCLSCAAQRRLKLQRDRRQASGNPSGRPKVNYSFVKAGSKLSPKPELT